MIISFIFYTHSLPNGLYIRENVALSNIKGIFVVFFVLSSEEKQFLMLKTQDYPVKSLLLRVTCVDMGIMLSEVLIKSLKKTRQREYVVLHKYRKEAVFKKQHPAE